jgi:hypothetical protein
MNRIALIAGIALLQIVSLAANATEWVTKEKKLHHAYSMRPSDQLAVINVFGNVTVNTWDKNELTVDIIITVKARNEKKAEDMMAHASMNVDSDAAPDNMIVFESGVRSGCNIANGNELHIDYVINMPKQNDLRINNKYGAVTIGNLTGNLNLNLSYGNLEAAVLSGADNIINLSFGKSAISRIEGGKLIMKHGELRVDRMQHVMMSNSFSKVDITTVAETKIAHSYGDLKIGTARNTDYSVSHSNLRTGELKGDTKLSLSYCSAAALGNITGDAKNIGISAAYSNIDCSFAHDANLVVTMTMSYGSFKDQAGTNMHNISSDNHTDSYKGTVGKGDGALKISGKYSHVKFR